MRTSLVRKRRKRGPHRADEDFSVVEAKEERFSHSMKIFLDQEWTGRGLQQRIRRGTICERKPAINKL